MPTSTIRDAHLSLDDDENTFDTVQKFKKLSNGFIYQLLTNITY